jgi:hypothetical protein
MEEPTANTGGRMAKATRTLAIGGVSSPLDSFVETEGSVLRTKPD